MLIKGYISKLCGETLTDSRMGIPVPRSILLGFSASLVETQRKAAINAPCQYGQDPYKLGD
jgi:hypothetical protein